MNRQPKRTKFGTRKTEAGLIKGFFEAIGTFFRNEGVRYILWSSFSVCAAFLAGFVIGKLKTKKADYKTLKGERQDAVKRSRSVLTGQMAEQIAPFFPDFPANPTEIRFIGKPVDYIAFNGASSGKISGVTFIEVKSGNSSLSPVEKSLKEAVLQGRVYYTEYRTEF